MNFKDMKQTLKKYAELQARIKGMELMRDQLKEEIIEELHKDKLEKVESEYGKFTISARRSYTYTESVKKLEEKVKLAKIKEEEKGLATPKVTEYLTFTPVKD